MTRRACFELCAETVQAARAAEKGGADRVELCVNLAVGGTTPPLVMTRDVIGSISIPAHVLIRPRAGDFVYTPEEFDRMRDEIGEAREAGASGVVLGVLREDGRVDVERTRALVEAARPMKTTFHRAFDEAHELGDALEDVIATGADWLLTSGGNADVLDGAEAIAKLVIQAAGRIQVMAGGGLRLASLREVRRRTGVEWLHGSLLRREENATRAAGRNTGEEAGGEEVREEDVREVMRLLRE
ncbi:MAG TPA: copper homeostasis protein CutC [Terracidiphilus sp.]|nr:copper homeostasis protein CutC [Terracidiphilus sp.]